MAMSVRDYPRSCRKNIIKIMYMLSTDAETAFSLLKMNAQCLDLDMDDDGVFYAILLDCGGDALEVRS